MTLRGQFGSVVMVPLPWIVRGKPLGEGADVCADAMRRSDAELQQSFEAGAPVSRPRAP